MKYLTTLIAVCLILGSAGSMAVWAKYAALRSGLPDLPSLEELEELREQNHKSNWQALVNDAKGKIASKKKESLQSFALELTRSLPASERPNLPESSDESFLNSLKEHVESRIQLAKNAAEASKNANAEKPRLLEAQKQKELSLVKSLSETEALCARLFKEEGGPSIVPVRGSDWTTCPVGITWKWIPQMDDGVDGFWIADSETTHKQLAALQGIALKENRLQKDEIVALRSWTLQDFGNEFKQRALERAAAERKKKADEVDAGIQDIRKQKQAYVDQLGSSTHALEQIDNLIASKIAKYKRDNPVPSLEALTEKYLNAGRKTGIEALKLSENDLKKFYGNNNFVAITGANYGSWEKLFSNMGAVYEAELGYMLRVDPKDYWYLGLPTEAHLKQAAEQVTGIANSGEKSPLTDLFGTVGKPGNPKYANEKGEFDANWTNRDPMEVPEIGTIGFRLALWRMPPQ